MFLLHELSNIFVHSTTGAILVIISLALSLFDASKVPMLEAAVCRHWYLAHNQSIILEFGPQVPERLCKLKPIQTTVAELNGGDVRFAAVASLLLALPYAWLSAKIDKRVLVMVGTCSTPLKYLFFYLVCHFATFDLRLIWLNSIFDVFGGGIGITYLILWSMVAKRTLPKLRSSVFFAISSILLFIQFLATATSGWLLRESLWMVCPVAALVCAISIPISACGLLCGTTKDNNIEETGAEYDTPPNPFEHTEQDYTLLPGQESTSSQGVIPGSPASLEMPRRRKMTRFCSGIAPALSFLSLLHKKFLQPPVIQVALLSEMTVVLGMGQNMIVQQWVSQVFGWSLPDTTFITAFTMLVSQVVLALTPLLTSRILPLFRTSQLMDWSLTQANLGLRACGALAMGLSTSPPTFFIAIFIYTLGVGLLDSSKALLTSFTSSVDITELYTVQMMVQNIAGMLGSELWPRVFAQQLEKGGVWIGLPFWTSAVLYLSALLLVRRLPSLWSA
ncbi:hypothetical protein EJ08DRAFT_474960 [Tothia fuscella]|uniref:MFS transporter n=1 Tax=Tothia fuscella TaxID=1048955 RepID=A0A9P4TUR7_9PEZI|nr:hypothetical protein EJ08DRAFT_474960 [Tothia fuscella]